MWVRCLSVCWVGQDTGLLAERRSMRCMARSSRTLVRQTLGNAEVTGRSGYLIRRAWELTVFDGRTGKRLTDQYGGHSVYAEAGALGG